MAHANVCGTKIHKICPDRHEQAWTRPQRRQLCPILCIIASLILLVCLWIMRTFVGIAIALAFTVPLPLSLPFVLPFSLFPASPFSSSFCVKFTFAHQDLFQQQNLRSTRKSLLRTSTVLFFSLCEFGGIFPQYFDASSPHSCPCPCPCHASHLIIILQSILLIIQNCA